MSGIPFVSVVSVGRSGPSSGNGLRGVLLPRIGLCVTNRCALRGSPEGGREGG